MLWIISTRTIFPTICPKKSEPKSRSEERDFWFALTVSAAAIYEVRKKALYFSGKYVIIITYLYRAGKPPQALARGAGKSCCAKPLRGWVKRGKLMCAINYESLILFGKFGGGMLGLLLLVWLIALLTPKAAALIDKLAGKPRPERVEDNIKPEEYEAHSFFEDVPLKKQEARDDEK